MKRTLPLLLLTLLIAGCATPMSVSPGRAGLRVEVRAAPKAGWSDSTDAYGAGGGPSGGAYARVDYRRLDDIVVWIIPSVLDGAPPPPTLKINAPDSSSPLLATGAGGRLLVTNRAGGPLDVYSLTPQPLSIGPIAPGAQAEAALASPGVVELWSDRGGDPLATIYVAPSPWVRLARAGEALQFGDLPPGPCEVHTWHPRLPGSVRTVELRPDTVIQAEALVSVNSLQREQLSSP